MATHAENLGSIPEFRMSLQKEHLLSSIFAIIGSITGTLTILLNFFGRKKRGRNCPPHLPSLPWVGTLPFLPHFDKMPEYALQKAKELGNIFSLKFGPRYAVVLTGRETIEEALVKQSAIFSNRPTFYTDSLINPNRKGFVGHPYDADFIKIHRLSLRILRNLGLGHRSIENRTHLELEDLFTKIRATNGVAFNPKDLINLSLGNTIFCIFFGQRFEDIRYHDLMKASDDFVKSIMKTGSLEVLPLLRFTPKMRKILNTLISADDTTLEILDGMIESNENNDLAENFISKFIQLEGESFDRSHLRYILRDILFGALEAILYTLLWSIAILANRPEVQRRLGDEINSVIPRNRYPCLEDRSSLPLVESAIVEVMRYKTVAPLSVIHETTEDTDLKGYFIPKGSLVIPNLIGTHMDPDVFENPEIFKPERYLDGNGKFVKNKDVIPFSLGKRACLGEVLAQQEIFLFLTGLLQQFHISPPADQETISGIDDAGYVNIPKDYEVRFVSKSQ